MSSNENVSTQRVQLVRHTFSYFFSYYWISLTLLLLLCQYMKANHGTQFQSPWSDSSSYVDYTSKHAAMAAAWVAIAGISVRGQKATSIISSCLSRRMPSFCIALILAFNSSILIVANYAWLTKKGDIFFSKLTSGATGIGFSLAALISPYLFILLAQGNPDTKTLEKRRQYLNREQIYLQNLVNAAAVIEKEKQESSRVFRRITYSISALVIYFAASYIPERTLHHNLPLANPSLTFMAVLIVLTSIAYFIIFLLTSWIWKQLCVQKTVDFNGEKLRQILLEAAWKMLCTLIKGIWKVLLFVFNKIMPSTFSRSSRSEEYALPEEQNQDSGEASNDSVDPENEDQPSKKGLIYYISATFTSIAILALLFSAAYILFVISTSVFWHIIPEIPYIKNVIYGNYLFKLVIALLCGAISMLSAATIIDLYSQIRRQPSPINFKQWKTISISQVASKGLAANERDKVELEALNEPNPLKILQKKNE